MNTNIKYLLKISLIITVVLFIVERLLFKGGFNLPVNELLKVFGVHFMWKTIKLAMFSCQI